MDERVHTARAGDGPGELPLRVLVTTESTYPFHWGGLSTWCHSLIRELPDVEFSLIAVSSTPLLKAQFELPPNVVDFRPVPLWGVSNAWEIDPGRSAWSVVRRRRRTVDRTIERQFVPAYRAFLSQLLGADRDDAALAGALVEIHRFFDDYDFDRTFRSRVVWDAFTDEIVTRYPAATRRIGYPTSSISLAEASAASQWIYHWLFPLAQGLPRVDVAHATMAGLCSLLAVVCKVDQGAGFLLSEHGIYLRESYLAEHASSESLFGKILKLGFARRMTEIAYAYADAVAPCCDYNHRWESRVGVDTGRIRTAYYGVDSSLFEPRSRVAAEAPVVAWAGRIDPLKDVETLLRAAAVVRDARPEVKFRLYGAAPPGNEEYNERCLALHAELGLQETVTFEGFSSNVVEAFADADLVVLSSISEGFPYSTLEAMLCGKPIVATAVGGIAEQVTVDCGRVVRPRAPQALGAAILDVLSSPEACQALSEAARERAVTLFGMERFRATHREIYDFVVEASDDPSAPSSAAAERPTAVGMHA